MTATKETIARKALLNLGITVKVTSMTTPSTLEEKTIAGVYNTERDYVLGDFPWPFAKEYVELGDVDGSSTDPVNSDWTYAYAIPEGCITVRRLVPQEGRLSKRKIPFERGRHANTEVIFTDEEDAVAEITASISDDSLFDDHFVAAFAWRLAQTIAPSFPKLKDAVALCFQMYQAERDRSQVRSLSEAQPDAPQESKLTSDRY